MQGEGGKEEGKGWKEERRKVKEGEKGGKEEGKGSSTPSLPPFSPSFNFHPSFFSLFHLPQLPSFFPSFIFHPLPSSTPPFSPSFTLPSSLPPPGKEEGLKLNCTSVQEFSKFQQFPNRTTLSNRHHSHLVKVKLEWEKRKKEKAEKERQREVSLVTHASCRVICPHWK